jgi:hypothetical protein
MGVHRGWHSAVLALQVVVSYTHQQKPPLAMFSPPSFCWHPHIYTYVFQLRNKRRGLVAAPVSVRRSEVDMNFGAIANMEPIGSPQTKDLVCSSFFSEIGACDFFFLIPLRNEGRICCEFFSSKSYYGIIISTFSGGTCWRFCRVICENDGEEERRLSSKTCVMYDDTIDHLTRRRARAAP